MPARLTTEEFITKSKDRWGDTRWEYSKVEYLNQTTKVTLTCPLHGDFDTSPKKHLAGTNGCGYCTGQKVTTETFIARSEEIYGKGRWLYDRTIYRSAFVPVEIGCPVHGHYFTQTPNNHLNSIGCRSCSQRFSRGKLSLAYVEERAAEVFGEGALDFSDSTYVNSKTPVKVTCTLHDESFEQQPEYLLLGQRRCPKCQKARKSAGEDSLWEFVESLGIKSQRWRRDLLGDTSMEVDIFIPSHKVAIEFNGLYFHSEKFLPNHQHARKRDLAVAEGIRLIQVWEDDWRERPHIVQEHIRQVLGVSPLPKVSARKTHPSFVGREEAKRFLNQHHIQGFVGSTHYVGLFADRELVALGSFKARGDGDFELTRYATSAQVRGGHSKIIAYFERSVKYRNLVTFADLCFSDGSLYRNTGWMEDKYLPPDYFYTKGIKRVHKFSLRISRIRKSPNLKFEEGKTERELAAMNNFLRVYDAGKIRFIKPHP